MAQESYVMNKVLTKIMTTEGYPTEADKEKNGIAWYKEDSYQGRNNKIEVLLSSASKGFTGNAGRPDFVIDCPNFYIVIETKGIEKTNNHKHSRFSDVNRYINRNAIRNDDVYDTTVISNRECAIDEALYYATFLNSEKDVIAIAASGDGNDKNFRWTSFYLPKDKNLSYLYLLEDCGLNGSFKTIKDYKRMIYKALGYEEKLYQEVYEGLRQYADACAKFLNTNGIDESDRLGLVSAVILALTNKESKLFELVQDRSNLDADDVLKALISTQKPYGVIIKDELPIEKMETLTSYFEGLLRKPKLGTNIQVKNGKEVNAEVYFAENKEKTNSIISRLTYSLYKFIIAEYEVYQSSKLDVMGTFYSLFLQYAKADAKKGVVLTPKHITELFCDLAEYYSEQKLTENTQVLDICTGSGGFLIAALNRMDKNIEDNMSLSEKQKEERKRKARENCLVGIELKDSMFVLAYANMRFHGDGKSSLYNGSSLYNSQDILANGKTFEQILVDKYRGSEDLSNLEKIKACGPDIGLINPPYEEDVFEFISSMLTYLKVGAIGIAIVPINTQATNSEVTAKKNALLEEHTLLASILMPPTLFAGVRGSGAATSTCILVFRAHCPHREFLNRGGLTYLADWSVDGFKMVKKHGRFEQNNKWYKESEGYKDMYMADLKKVCGERENILSSLYQKDIHNASAIKSIRKPIHKYSHTDRIEKVDKDGNPIYKKDLVIKRDKAGNIIYKKSKGVITDKPQTTSIFVLDENGNKIPDFDEIEVFINEDWNILDYVETDYKEMTDDDFIKTLMNFNLFKYMKENDLLFSEED